MLKLTNRERELLALFLRAGGRIEPVAAAMQISLSTARGKKDAIYKKLKVRNGIELTREAIRRGLYEVGDM